VGEAVAEVVGVAAGEDLGFGFEAAEGAGVNDTIAIALKVVAVGMRGLKKTASAGALDVHRVGGQHEERIALLIDECWLLIEDQKASGLSSTIRNHQSTIFG
jgi:hypothetical protein